jgi:hypothetical protein
MDFSFLCLVGELASILQSVVLEAKEDEITTLLV